MTTRAEKQPYIDKLRTLLQVAGTETHWPDIEADLFKMKVNILAAMTYRVQQAISDAYALGEREGMAIEARAGQ